MANVRNILKNKPVEEAGDYLEANGYYRKEKNLTGTMFIKDDRAVLIYADKVSFREYNSEHDEIEFAEFASFEGISILNTIDWIYLFHITSIIPLKQFLKNVKKDNVVPINKTLLQPFNMVQLAESLFKNAKPALILLALFFFASCTTSKQIYQRKGFFNTIGNSAVFKPVSPWELYTPHSKTDTIYQYYLTAKKPRS